MKYLEESMKPEPESYVLSDSFDPLASAACEAND